MSALQSHHLNLVEYIIHREHELKDQKKKNVKKISDYGNWEK